VSPEQIVTIIAIVTTAWTCNRILRPLAEAFARRISHTESGATEREAEYAAQLAEARQRLAELEERMDFNERVLLQGRELPELGDGGGS
jgi:Tfp pilus assembly protein PilO